jgi:hypothetical protein
MNIPPKPGALLPISAKVSLALTGWIEFGSGSVCPALGTLATRSKPKSNTVKAFALAQVRILWVAMVGLLHLIVLDT